MLALQMSYRTLERVRGPKCSGSDRWGWQGLGQEPRALGSLLHSLDVLGSLLQGLRGGGAAALEGTSP